MSTYRVRARSNAETGRETILHFDHASGLLHIEERQSAEAIMATLRGVDAARDAKRPTKDSPRLYASVPNIVGLQWANEAGVRYGSAEYDEVAARKLKDLDFRRLRADK
jgi:glyoxylase-like metal-dependent hydrolase (beta-lactamase superfamily II)